MNYKGKISVDVDFIMREVFLDEFEQPYKATPVLAFITNYTTKEKLLFESSLPKGLPSYKVNCSIDPPLP